MKLGTRRTPLSLVCLHGSRQMKPSTGPPHDMKASKLYHSGYDMANDGDKAIRTRYGLGFCIPSRL